MRRIDKQAPEEDAWAILAASPTIYLAGVGNDGAPILRPVHAIVHQGQLYIHSAPDGEKLQAMGGPVVAMCHEVLAEVPSNFTHRERACPATTFYRSASLHGVMEEVHDLTTKAAVLQALMERYQPQGGYRPILVEDPMYAASVRGVAVLRLVAHRVACKVALGQGKRTDQRARFIRGLWGRGAQGDVAAAQAVYDAKPMPLPEWMAGPHGTRLVLAGGNAHVAGAVSLLKDEYWNVDVDTDRLAKAQQASDVWMVLVDHEDQVVATARALTDGHKTSTIADVAVHPQRRGTGLGRFLMERILEHPQIRGTRVDLLTVNAGPFYQTLGFHRGVSLPYRLNRRVETAV